MARGRRVRPARNFAGGAGGNRPATGNRGGGGGRRRGRGRGRGGGNSVGKFLAPHTGRQAGAIANAQAGAEYNPEIRQLRQQAKGSRARERDIQHWFDQLASEYGEGQDAGLAALQAVQDTTSAQLGEAADRGKATLEGLSAEDEAFAKLVGGPKDTEGLAKIAQAGAAAERARVSMAAPIAQEQANFVARLGGDRAAAKLQGIEERQGERNRRDKILSELGGVRKEKGAARVARKEDIRAADRDYSLANRQQRLAERELTEPTPYDEALSEQSQLGLQGDLASARAQEVAAGRYGSARERGALATERAARAAERGRKASARGQVKSAGIYGRNADKGGYNVREAVGLLREGFGRKRVTASHAVDYLVNRGVVARTAEAAVRRLAGRQRSTPPVPYAPTKKGREAYRRARRRGRER